MENPRTFTFNSHFIKLSAFGKQYTDQQIKNEPMFFRASGEFVADRCGPITDAFLLELQKYWRGGLHEISIDSRAHMLMPGWYPCIPGWHHDEVPRTRSDGQPDYTAAGYMTEHCMALVNADIAPTEFAFGTITLPDVPLGSRYYEVWHPLVNAAIRNSTLQQYEVQDRELIFFDQASFHQGTQAVTRGWRFFIRATRNFDRPFANEIRKQAQVYLPAPFEGW